LQRLSLDRLLSPSQLAAGGQRPGIALPTPVLHYV
jgi:hypothetical protein